MLSTEEITPGSVLSAVMAKATPATPVRDGGREALALCARNACHCFCISELADDIGQLAIEARDWGSDACGDGVDDPFPPLKLWL